MSNYNNLKTAIQQVIKQNGKQEITGYILQSTLLAMVNSIGENYQYVGIATPELDPGSPDQNVMYITSQKGVKYKCTRDSGIPLSHDLSALVGLYVEVV